MNKLREHIMLCVFLPFIIQSVSCIFYFSRRLHEDTPLDRNFWRNLDVYSSEFFIIVTTIYFAIHEVIQLIPVGGRTRDMEAIKLLDVTNILELISIVLNLFLILNEWIDRAMTNNNALRFFALIAIAIVWFKAFYWMRLFDRHAFFMNLLKKTLQGITSFILMLAILLGCTANMIYIINKVDHDYT